MTGGYRRNRRQLFADLGKFGIAYGMLSQISFADSTAGQARSSSGPFVHPPISRSAFGQRIARIRQKMHQQELSCLLVSSVLNHAVRYIGFFDCGLQGEPSGAPQLVSVLLPLEHDPVVYLQTFTAADYMLPRAKAASYIDDLRLVGGDNRQVLDLIANQLRGWKLESARIGLAGGEIDWAERLFFGETLPKMELIDANPLLDGLRIVKDREEIALMRESAALADAAMLEVEKHIASGVTDGEIYGLGEYSMLRSGADEDTQVLMGIGPSANAMLMDPLNGRRLKKGDILIYEALPFYRLYNTEVAATFALGKPSDRQWSAAEACEAAYQAGLSEMKPGIRTAKVVESSLKAFQEHGWKSYTHTPGHFVGLDNYEGPPLRHPDLLLEPGMVLSFHPNVVVANEVKETVCAMFLVTDSGVERISKYEPRGIRIV